MISVLVSSLSLVVIVVVTVVLVNKSIDDETKRKTEIRRIVDQVNTVNDSGYDIETKQNNTIMEVNKSIDALRSDVKSYYNTFAKKSDFENEMVSKVGKFDDLSTKNLKLDSDNLALGKKTILSHNEKDGFNVQLDGNKIVGFDTNNSSKRFALGSEFSVINSGKNKAFTEFDVAGDVFVKTESDKARMILQNGDKGPGIVLSGNKVGIGADPQFATMDVNGDLAVMGEGIHMGADKYGKPQKMIGIKDNAMTIQADNGITMQSAKGIKIPSDVVFGGNIMMTNANIRSSETDKGITFKDGKVGIGMVPKTNTLDVAGDVGINGDNIFLGSEKQHRALNIEDNKIFVNKDGTLKSVNIDGNLNLTNQNFNNRVSVSSPSDVEFKIGQSINNLPVPPILRIGKEGTIVDGKVWGDSYIGQTSYVDNVYNNRGLYANQNGGFWTIYNNNDKSLVFHPEELTTLNSTGESSGVFNLLQDGTIKSKAGAIFDGKVEVQGSIGTNGTLSGRQLCLKTSADPLCLQQEDILYVRQQGEKFRSGEVPATQAQITILNQQIQYLQDQISGLRM